MPSLAALFRLFLSGKHLNRVVEPALWAELEQQEAAYLALFTALGYELRIDARGFAWFHNKESGSNIRKTSRHLALLFLVIFDTQANDGKLLQRFAEWQIDAEWLAGVYKAHREVLDAEELDPDALVDLLNRACTLGFATPDPAGWRLLPAVYRYLDYFESLAKSIKASDEEANDFVDEDVESENEDEEENF